MPQLPAAWYIKPAMPTEAVFSAGRMIGSQNLDGSLTLQPYILAQTAVPVILVPTGTSNATGQITLGTALPYQPSGTVQIYLPTGVVTAGAKTGAGLYSVTFSSTTVCQLTDTTAVTANGAYTQDTTIQTLATVVVPGGAMGANGALRTASGFSYPNNANTKAVNHRLAGNTFVSASGTTTVQAGLSATARNRGNQASQMVVNTASVSTSPPGYFSVDTSVNQTVTFNATLAVATDYIILEGYTVEVLPAA